MKKILSMALASAMVASMAATAFAADPTYKIMIKKGDAVNSTIFTWDKDAEVIVQNGTPNSGGTAFDSGSENDVSYGSTVYYALNGVQTNALGAPSDDKLVYEYDAVKGLKLKETWTMNGNLVEKVELVKKKISTTTVNLTSGNDSVVDAVSGTAGNYSGAREYAYFIAVSLKDGTSTSEKFVNGEIALAKSSGKYLTGTDDKLEYKNDKFEVALDVSFDDAVTTTDDKFAEKDKKVFFTQDSEKEEDYELVLINEETATFVVDTRGQGKLTISASNKFDADIAAKFDADLNFIKTNGATFNKTGVLTIYAEEGTYLYEIKADGTLAKSRAKYDDVEEAFVIKTRTLGNYVISSEELDLAGNTTEEELEVVEPGEEVVVEPTTPVNPNPSTGAAA